MQCEVWSSINKSPRKDRITKMCVSTHLTLLSNWHLNTFTLDSMLSFSLDLWYWRNWNENKHSEGLKTMKTGFS